MVSFRPALGLGLLGLALGCSTPSATLPGTPSAVASEPAVEPEAGPEEPAERVQATESKPPSCRDAYTLQLLVPDEALSYSLGRNARAIVAATETCPPESSDEHATTAIARQYLEDGDALAHADAAVELAPGSAYAWFARGFVHRYSDRNAEAEPALRHALELDPTRGEIYLELGLVLEEEGRLEASRAMFREGVAARPSYILNDYFLALSYLEAGELDQAAPHCEATLVHDGDNDMYICRGLARARAGDHAGVVEDLTGVYDSGIYSQYAEPIYDALREALLATGDPVAAAKQCVYEHDYDVCEADREVLDAIELQRDEAQHEASEGSYESASKLSPKQFARELAAQGQSAVALHDFVHPEIGLFVFRPHGWQLTHHRSWPTIPEADPRLELATLLNAHNLRMGYAEEVNELGCAYPLDSVFDAGGPRGLPQHFNAGGGLVEDDYRLCTFEVFDEDYGNALAEPEFDKMQRAALSISHIISYGRQAYEFGKIGDSWYVLTITVGYDANEDACG